MEHLALEKMAWQQDREADSDETAHLDRNLTRPVPILTEPTLASLSDSDGQMRQDILDALKETAGNQKAAAELLNISRRTLANRLDRLNIPRPRKNPA